MRITASARGAAAVSNSAARTRRSSRERQRRAAGRQPKLKDPENVKKTAGGKRKLNGLEFIEVGGVSGREGGGGRRGRHRGVSGSRCPPRGWNKTRGWR